MDSSYSKMVANPRPMDRRAAVAVGICGAALCFGLGWVASRVMQAPNREPLSTPSSQPVSYDDLDAGPAPLLLIDPSKVTLLPDASLEIELPREPLLSDPVKPRSD